jgi:D-alanyl-D-alanine carboxypeptidase
MTAEGCNPRMFRLAHWAAGLCLAAAALGVSTPQAEARGAYRNYAHHRYHAYAPRHRVHYAQRATPSDSNFSAIVVDGNTGREIYGVNENGLRHPASITKVMTLYLLFDQLEKGTLTLQSRIPISEHAAAQQPSKLGISAGDDISVEDAIKAVVTRSANDIAVAIAEAVGHDEDNFCVMMTRKAHSLGMSRTIYRDASGLPNDEQITSARDLAVLGRAIQERFPQYFKYFSTHEFVYDGEVIGNHNHLLGRIDGVDGIKTGYTNASGFNLLTSVHKDGRSLVAVVMGGRSAAGRDRIMENLISDHLAEASVGGHPTNMVAENDVPDEDPAPAHLPAPHPQLVADNVAPPPQAHHAIEPLGQGDQSGEDSDDEAPAPKAAAKLSPRVAASAKPVEPVHPQPSHAERVAAASPETLSWKKGPDGPSRRGARPAARKPASRAPMIPMMTTTSRPRRAPGRFRSARPTTRGRPIRCSARLARAAPICSPPPRR